MILVIYILFSYLYMYGVKESSTIKGIPFDWILVLLSPVTFPIYLGGNSTDS